MMKRKPMIGLGNRWRNCSAGMLAVLIPIVRKMIAPRLHGKAKMMKEKWKKKIPISASVR